jgi:hypothetical protein
MRLDGLQSHSKYETKTSQFPCQKWNTKIQTKLNTYSAIFTIFFKKMRQLAMCISKYSLKEDSCKWIHYQNLHYDKYSTKLKWVSDILVESPN